MKPLIRVLAVAFFAFILWVIYLANSQQSSLFFEFVAAIPFGDKLGHAGLFGALTFLAVLGSSYSGLQLNRIKLYYGALAVATFVVSEEISQAFIPSRTFDATDLAADAVGILLAVLALKKLNQTRQSKANS